MPRTTEQFVINAFKKCLAFALAVLQVGFGLPQTASAATTRKHSAAQTSAVKRFTGNALASAQMKLASLETRGALAARSVVSTLNPPKEFAQLTSCFEEPLIPTGQTSSREDKALRTALEHFREPRPGG